MSVRLTPAARTAETAFDPETYLRERYVGHRSRTMPLRGYYAVKPLLPRGLQLALRRRHARRRARRTFPAWPSESILVDHFHHRLRAEVDAAGGAPIPLVGLWPEGRRFAAILTHDVEGTAGIEQIPRVLEVERRYGMVSSWNFVADWYPIPEGTFDQVRAAGGEIGLHGIKHDGRLFASRTAFSKNLGLIHQKMGEWGAVGFRSPATHRNAEWMPELGCLYDSSFPDTDPFEPQPGGCCSILPYLLDDLVELPITLVQDHTLWEILQDDSIDLWTQKTNWIIENNGLVNIILHPDYVITPERLAIYERFLAFLRSRLDAEHGWHALPRDVATWWRTREGLVLERDGGEVRVTGPGAADSGATVAWARPSGEGVVIEAG